MGDFRADIQISVDFFGKKYKMDSYINYEPDSSFDGVDQRVVDFFRESWEDAKRRYDDMTAKMYVEQHKKELEEQEKQELKRLKEKYE